MKQTLQQSIEAQLVSEVKQAVAEFDINDYVSRKKLERIVDEHIEDIVYRKVSEALEYRVMKAVNEICAEQDDHIKRVVFEIAREKVIK